jgi:riboflavin synthase
MFTGIIEEAGRIEAIRPKPTAIELIVRSRICSRRLKTGDSVAVNGCCLTVEKITPRRGGKLLQFALLAESWKRTTFQFAAPGDAVNLERALRVGDPLGGHFVSGHIDGLGKIIRWEHSGKDYVLEISAPPDIMRYVIFKGSIAMDGISLTVAAARKGSFQIWIIPQTRAITALSERKTGDAVNLEADLIGKYIERFVTATAGASASA